MKSVQYALEVVKLCLFKANAVVGSVGKHSKNTNYKPRQSWVAFRLYVIKLILYVENEIFDDPPREILTVPTYEIDAHLISLQNFPS